MRTIKKFNEIDVEGVSNYFASITNRGETVFLASSLKIDYIKEHKERYDYEVMYDTFYSSKGSYMIVNIEGDWDEIK